MTYLQKWHKNQGSFGCFISLLVVFLGLSILGAIALPDLLSCGNKAKLVEAKQTLSAINKGQEAHQLEKKTFANNFDDLGVGIKTQTTNYIYFTTATKTAAFSYAIARNEKLTSYIGAVFLVPAKDEMKTVSILCQAKLKGSAKLQDPTLQNGVPTCGADSENHRL